MRLGKEFMNDTGIKCEKIKEREEGEQKRREKNLKKGTKVEKCDEEEENGRS